VTAPTKPGTSDILTGIDALLAGNPMGQTPRGGMETDFRGETHGAGTLGKPSGQSFDENGVQQQADPFKGMGPLLEDEDSEVFQQVHGLILRQELIALNHLAQDTHWTLVKLGYPWSTLTKEPGKDQYKQELPYGTAGISIQAVPNKVWDLINKTTGSLLVDFPEAEAEPADDSEQAEAACEMANRFLSQDASEQGTNDAVLFNDRVNRAMTTASTYLECWTDPTGGGYVPLQIKAHPQAESPANPLVDAQGNPTTDYVLRYVTADQQFTDDPSQAAPQWQPKLRAAKWQREHIRVYPESATVDNADKIIILGFCTLGEARKRWQSVAQMEPAELSSLTDWTPTRYLPLLPPFQRARWKLTDGREKERQGSSDERIMFYYHIYAKASPDYPKGADVVVSGKAGGFVIDRKLLSKEVEVPKAQGTAKETRCMEIPVVQVTPFGDPDDVDPSGRAFVELIAGAAENNAHLSMSFSEVVDKILHTPFVTPSTSPIHGEDVENAAATGDFLQIIKPEDKPVQLTPPVLPTAFFNMYELADNAIDSAANQNKPAQGSDKQQEVSGKARQIAIAQNNVPLSGPQTAVNNAYARWCRIKCERVMSDFSTPQQLSYVGEDGAYKQQEFSGVDFALIGKVTIKTGTGTLMPPDQKVQYLGNLKEAGFLSPDEAMEAARPAFAKRLGLQANPHEQYVERCIDAWLKGPPEADPNAPPDPMTGQPSDWASQYRTWMQAQQQYEAQQAQYQQAVQQQQQAMQNAAIVAGGPAQPLGPEQQNETANRDFGMATLALQTNPYNPTPLVPPQPPQVPKPWTPFTPRPNDNEPFIAALWARKISNTMSSPKYTQFGPEWKDVLDRQYQMTRQAAAVASAAQQPAPQPGQPKPVQAPKPQQPGRPQPPQQSQPAQPAQPGGR
jgi:hypothetical protein